MKRAVKFLKISGLVAAIVLAIGLIANAILIRNSGAELESRLAQLRTEQQPTSLSELAPIPVEADKNAAVRLRRVKDQIVAVAKDLETAKTDSGMVLPGDQQAAVMRAAFAAYPQLIPTLKEAADCEHYDSQLDYTLEFQDFLNQLLPVVQNNRAVYRVLSGHILVLAKDGKHDAALAECITLLKLTRHLEREPTIVSHLVMLACRGVAIQTANIVLQTGDVSPASREALMAELALHDTSDSYKHALRTERACGLSAYQDITPWSQNWFMRAYWNRDVCHYLDLFSGEIAASDLPPWKAPPIGFSDSESHPMVASIVPAVQAARDANIRVRAAVRCLRVLTALKGLPEEPGHLPVVSTLGLPEEATTDPFNGQPLIIKRLPGGWLVYSVGSNGQDDGGDLTTPLKDVGVGPQVTGK